MAARRILALLAGFAAFIGPASAAPARVMSANACTDQLALLLARPGQVVSVSALAADPRLSVMAERATGLPLNHGRAEDVFIVRPDLVLAADFSLHGMARFARAAGFSVEEFAYDQSLDSIADSIERVGRLLGVADTAGPVAAAYRDRLGELRARACPRRPGVIVRGQNGVVQGAGTIAGDIVEAAGFKNLAATLGVVGMAPFPLERLVAEAPDLVLVESQFDDRASLADMAIAHPVIARLAVEQSARFGGDGAWTCGGPWSLDIVAALAEWREHAFPCGGAPQ